MSKTKVVPLRIPEHLDELAAFTAREEHVDKATALRQWLHQGAALYVVKLVSEGRMSATYAAGLLDVSVYDIYGFAERHGIELGATAEQAKKSLDLVDRLWPRGSDKK